MKISIEKNVFLAPYTTYGIGGKADYFVVVKDKESLLEALNWALAEKIDFHVIGGGSNVLIADKGIRGVVILNRANNYSITGEKVSAESGASLLRVAKETMELGLSGLDFAAGIPGTVGGAVVGNAGAYGRSISDSLLSGEVWENGKVRVYSNHDFSFAYRYSNIKNNPEKVLITANFFLHKGNIDEMKSSMKEDEKRRKAYAGKNCGSYFCNIKVEDLNKLQKEKLSKFIVQDKLAVGKILDSLGMKGKKVGGAMVSMDHANVVLNTGTATAKDILDLEKEIMKAIFEEYGIVLIPEVTKIGEF